MQGDDRFAEAGESDGVAYSTTGSFRYQAVRPDAALVTLIYDDGDVCRTNLYFESVADGRFASRCSDSASEDGLWSGGSWSALDHDAPIPGDPTDTVREGDCYPGLLVRISESCRYPGTTEEFTVSTRSRGRFLTFLAGIRLNVRNETIDGRVYDFGASHQGDGVWRIDRVAGRTEMPSFGAAQNPGNRTYAQGMAIEPLVLPEASGGNSPLRYSLSPAVPGLSFAASTRRLTGTPTTVGRYDMSYTVTDSDGDADTLGFTITVEAAEVVDGDGDGNGVGDGDGDGGTGGDPDDAVTVDRVRCTGVRTSPSAVLVAMIGIVRAERSVTDVRVVGYANDLLVGTQVLGNIPAGDTRSFSVSGEINASADSIECLASVYYLLADPIRGTESISIGLSAPL